MSYLGNTPTQQGFIPAIDYFSGNGSTVAFTLSRPVASVAQVQATIENVPQNPGTAFTVSGNTITFDGAPPSGTNNIYVYYTSPITTVIQPGQGTVGTAQLVSGLTLTNPVYTGTLTGGTGVVNIGSGQVYKDSSGNVGIGNTNPSSTYGAKLAVTGGNIIADFDRTIGFQWSGGLNQYFKGMSGVPQLAGGARGLHVFNYDNDASQGIRFWGGTFASKVEFGGFDSAGRMTTPLQPAFSVWKDGGSVTGSTSTVVVLFNQINLNVGSSYSSGTGRFTAPIAGNYYFSTCGMLDTSVTTAGDLQLCIRKNGSNVSISNPPMVGNNVQGLGFAASATIPLAANDYVDVGFYASNNASRFYAGGGVFNNFSGFLIG